MSLDNRIAVLIDADNVSDKYIKYILDEVSNDGTATYKRIYGDWTKPVLGSWKNVLLDNSITPIQQYGYTTGKNATDSAMIIDAMDILYSGHVDGFCLVSSDSDFTRLASRLRESGMLVLGMGEKKTPTAFIAACNKFKYLEILAQPAESSAPRRQTEEMTPLETVTLTRSSGALSTASVRTNSTLEMSLGWGRNRGLHPQSRLAVNTQQRIHAAFFTFASVSPLGSGIAPAV